MTLQSWPTVTDDSGTKQDGTIFNKALTDAIKASIEDSVFSSTNPSEIPADIIDEVVEARGSMPSLDDRLDVTLNEDGTPKANASYVAASTYQVGLSSRNVCVNGDFDDWANGAALAPDSWTLAGAAGTIAQCGPAMGDTFTFGAGRYCAKITRAGTDVTLSQDIVAAADIADYAEIKGRKAAVCAKVKASAGNIGRVRLDDGFTAAVGSSYHTGSGVVEHLTEVLSISSSATKLTVIGEVKNTNADVYFGGFAVVFADLAPTDWQPLSRELPATATRKGLVAVQQLPVVPKWKTAGTSTFAVQGSGRVFSISTNVGNVGAGEDDLINQSIPAGLLGTDGDILHIVVKGLVTNSANTKRLRAYFGATTLFDLGAGFYNDGVSRFWILEVWIQRDSATAQTVWCRQHAYNTTSSTAGGFTSTAYLNASVAAPAETLSGAIAFRVTGEATADNEIVMHSAYGVMI